MEVEYEALSLQVVDTARGQAFAEAHAMSFFETSAVDGTGVEEAVRYAARSALAIHMSQKRGETTATSARIKVCCTAA
jgi:hypothetical protein